MKTSFFTKAVVSLLVVTLVTPTSLFVAPRPATAAGEEAIEALSALLGATSITSSAPAIPTRDGQGILATAIGSIRGVLTSISAYTSAAADVAQQINTYILQPLAFVLSGRLMQFLTSSVLAFVVGKANGTGIPQFIVDVEKSFQTVADSQALAYLNQLGRHSNSPFASSIRSALYNNYASKTSLAGFWAANLNTLRRSSPNVSGYLSGRWQDGGIKAWFLLTTTSNDPYSEYEANRNKLAGVIGAGAGGATGAHAKKADWGQGFTSWCGPQSESSAAAYAAATEGQIGAPSYTGSGASPANVSYSSGDSAFDAGQAITPAQSAANAGYNAVNSVSGTYYTSAGVNPGAPCINADGTEGIIRTPGSMINDTLNRVLGGEQDRITRMGNVGPMINSILNNIATVVRTANFAAELLGGSSGGGLFGFDGGSAASPTPRSIQYQAAPPLGATTAGALGGGGAFASTIISDFDTRITQYETAWNAIRSAADSAKTNLTSLESACASQASAAQTARTTLVDPVLADAATAAARITDARAAVQRTQNAYNTNSPSYATELQALQTMTPTIENVVDAQQRAADSAATANPDGSLVVSGGSTLGQMNLLRDNAQSLQTNSCS